MTDVDRPGRSAVSGTGCDVCRTAVLRGELPEIGLSMIGHVIVSRCPACATCWFETERVAHPVTDEDARRGAPDVLTPGHPASDDPSTP